MVNEGRQMFNGMFFSTLIEINLLIYGADHVVDHRETGNCF